MNKKEPKRINATHNQAGFDNPLLTDEALFTSAF